MFYLRIKCWTCPIIVLAIKQLANNTHIICNWYPNITYPLFLCILWFYFGSIIVSWICRYVRKIVTVFTYTLVRPTTETKSFDWNTLQWKIYSRNIRYSKSISGQQFIVMQLNRTLDHQLKYWWSKILTNLKSIHAVLFSILFINKEHMYNIQWHIHSNRLQNINASSLVYTKNVYYML